MPTDFARQHSERLRVQGGLLRPDRLPPVVDEVDWSKLPPNELPARFPGEFEPCDALYLGLGELLDHHPHTMIDIVRETWESIPLVGVVNGKKQQQAALDHFKRAGLPDNIMHFCQITTKGMWLRDYGPSFVQMASEQMVLIDAGYLERDRAMDDRAPQAFGEHLRLPVVDIPLTIEGGNLLTNGEGLLVTTTAVVERNQDRKLDLQAIGGMLHRYYGGLNWTYLPILQGEPTGHVDMFMTFLAPDVVVIGSDNKEEDPINAGILDYAASLLEAAPLTGGRKMRVVRVPRPTHADGIWRSYTNVIMANGTLLVPQYASLHPARDQEAMETYRSLLPGWRVVGIDVTSMIKNRGALHCISLNLPAVK